MMSQLLFFDEVGRTARGEWLLAFYVVGAAFARFVGMRADKIRNYDSLGKIT